MGSAKYFISINLCSGFWQCRIGNEDNAKTAFFMRYGRYKWIVMHIGLSNAPTTFIHTMNNLFSNILDSGMVVFLDETLVYYHTVNEYY